jgi:hypothetical protein
LFEPSFAATGAIDLYYPWLRSANCNHVNR